MRDKRENPFELPKGEFRDDVGEVFKNDDDPTEGFDELYSDEAMELAFYDHNPRFIEENTN
jgi:hypothetical protein